MSDKEESKEEKTIRANGRIIYETIELKIDPHDGAQIVGKLDKMQNLLGLSAHNIALSKKLLRKQELIVLEELMEQKLQASVITKVLQARVGDVEYLYILSDRLHSALVHGIDALRSELSRKKEELNRGI